MKVSFDEWIRQLEEDVIQGEFGFEPGEFTVYRDHWRAQYREGLTPAQAWRRALDAHRDARIADDKARAENYARIVAEDKATIARYRESGGAQ